MSEHKFGGKVEPTQSQPKMAKLGETLPERVTYEQMNSQALGPISLTPKHATQAGLPGGPTAPIAAAPVFKTPAPKNVKA
jgi:hypothetical protein